MGRGSRYERNGCARLHALEGGLCGRRPNAWRPVSRKVDWDNFVLLPCSPAFSSPVPEFGGTERMGRDGIRCNGTDRAQRVWCCLEKAANLSQITVVVKHNGKVPFI